MSSHEENDQSESSCTVGGTCELVQNVELLRRIPVFIGIPLNRLKLYAYLGRRIRYRPGEFLFHQGEPDDKGYIVVSGRVQIIREFPDHSVLLNEFVEGDFFGGLSLLSDIRRLFSARARVDVECLAWDRESFHKILVQFPEVALKVVDMMIKRITQMEEKLLQSEAHECICV